MAKPDTRRRDRAAYMRDYRAKRAKERPGLEARIAHLEVLVAGLVEAGGQFHLNAEKLAQGVVEVTNARDTFGSSRPAPKTKAKG